MRIVYLLIFFAFLAGCGLPARQPGGDILVIGDSVLAWNKPKNGDIGRVIGAELQREVVSRATLGARLPGGSVGPLRRLNISDQLSAGPWNWIVMNGGANDLGFSCGCTSCEDEIDLLISRDAVTGAIPDLIAKARKSGANVLWIGYYQAPDSKSFRGCRPGLVELERRIANYARNTAGVFFIDAEEVFNPSTNDRLAADNTHPSIEGSAAIGIFAAREIAKHSR